MNSLRKFFRAMQYTTEDRKWTIWRDDMMLPPMRKHYDIRGIEQMAAYDAYYERLQNKRIELIEQNRLPSARDVIPPYIMREDRAGYKPESLGRYALELFP